MCPVLHHGLSVHSSLGVQGYSGAVYQSTVRDQTGKTKTIV